MVGAAAMRQAAEDVSAHSAVKEGWPFEESISYVTNMWQTSSLRSAAEEVAKKNFPEFERQDLIEEVMKAHQLGELDEEKLKRSWDEKSLYLFATMKIMKKKLDEKRLRRDVEWVAKKNFPEKEGQCLIEAVMKAFENGELDKGLEEMSREGKERYLLTTMQQMQEDLRSLRSKAEEVAKEHFPEKERAHLTERVMEAFKNGELDAKAMFYAKYLFRTMNRLRELPVAASAVKFCSNLFREATRARAAGSAGRTAHQEAEKAAGICHKVLTGELGADDGPEWAEKAANSSQPDGQHYQLGRLQKVNATEKAWKVSLKNVCKDECIELVKKTKEETRRIVADVGILPKFEKPPSYEEACAKHVVQKVEAEILGCCAESCGWNGRACMLWPFLNSTEKGEWEAECCTEFNILAGSSRATMCDATLTGKENNEVIRDEQPNSKKDRRMIGQDPVGKGTSFLQGEDTNGPNPPPENTPIPRYEGTCPSPLDLAKVHAKLKDEWKTIELPSARFKKFKNPGCGGKEPTLLIEKCTAFVPQTVNGPYICYGECLESVSWSENDPDLKKLDAESTGNTGLLYVHETIYKRSKGE